MKLSNLFLPLGRFFLKSTKNNKINQLYNIDTSNIKPDDDHNSLTYCTICDLLHINGNLIEHCEKCHTCHLKFKLYCKDCNNCYDYRLDKDIISHRKNCLLAFKTI